MTPQEFANKIRTKYPGSYDNVPDEELAQRVIAKYPVYKNQVNFETQKKPGIVQNIVQGLANPALRLVSSVRRGVSPTPVSLNKEYDYGYFGKAKPIPGPTDTEVPALEALKQNIAVGAELGATIAGGGTGIAKTVLGKAAQFGAIGAISGAAEAASENKNAKEIAKSAAIQGSIGAGTGAAFGLAEKGIRGLGKLLGATGDKIQTSVIKPSQADIKDGFSIETVNKYGLGGSLKKTFSKTDEKLDELSKQLSQKIGSSKSTVDLNDVYETTAKRILGNKFEGFGSNQAMERALDNLREEIVGTAGKNGLVSLPEAQLIKRASGHFGAWSYGIPTPEATATQKVYSTFYNEMKKAIERNSPAGVREINKQISELIPVMNALIRRIPVAERNATLSLSDIVSLSAAALEPRALSLSLLNLASKSGTVGSALSKVGPKIGELGNSAIQAGERAGKTLISE